MEHSLGKLTEAIIWGLVFAGMVAELINNVVKMGAAEGIVVFAGLSIATGSLFFSTLKDYLKTRN